MAVAPAPWRTRAPLLLWALVPAALVVALAAYTLVSSRALHQQRAELLSQNLASALAHTVAADIEKIDVTLSLIADLANQQLAEPQPDLASLAWVVRVQWQRHSALAGIRIVNQAGDTVVGENLPGQPPLSMADRDWFRQQRDATGDSLVISAPLARKVDGIWVVSISRRLVDGQGRFAGVVSAGLPLAMLERQLQAIDVGPHGVAHLRDLQDRLLARHNRDAGLVVQPLGSTAIPPALRAAIATGALAGTVPTLAASNGTVRTVSYNTIAGLPLRVVVGLAQQEYLAAWRQDLRLVVGATAAFLLLYGAGMCLLWRASARVRRAQQRVRLLADAFEHAGEAIALCDAEHRIIAVNPAFERLHGCAAADLIGQPMQSLRVDAPGLAGEPEIHWALADAGKWRGERLGRHRDGHTIPLWVTVTTVRDAQGRVLRYIGSEVDITERKNNTLELERHRAHLEELVLLRTQELEAARRHAEEASRAKSDFLANMSHEIRTPMNAIIGLNYLLRRDSASPEQMARLDKIESAGQHLLAIVNDILDLSKIEAGRMQLAQGSFHLSAVLDHVQSMVAESARAKGLRLQVHCDAVPGWLRGDATRLRQALLNYAGNAVKFTDHGGITLRAELLSEDSTGLRLRFSVQDTGIGIDAAQRERLFVPFEQADHTISRRFGGTGLGLVITRRLAELMGGEAGVDSHPGQGSNFWFTACVQRSNGPGPVPGPKSTADLEQQLRTRHAGTRVLLAEDNAVNREVVQAMLHAVHLEVEVAVDGHEALAQARAGSQALVLMDIQMPGMDGLQATRAIRTLPGWARRPILALTANAFDEDRQACSLAGMDDFIAKPLDVDALYTTLLKWLDAANAAPARRSTPAPQPAADVLPAPPALSQPAQAPADAASVLRRLAELPGLDTVRGLAMLRGNPARYLGLLRRFADWHATDATQMAQALQQGDHAQARRLAHALRGAASTLGADAIAATAGRIEALDATATDARAQHDALQALAAAQAALAQALA